MPGYLGGGGSSSGGVGGEIKFPKEFIDPVTKLRVSNPQNLIDTDFEYGLQPTKWETVELINNTPSFFSKSGDTTIDGINSITTNAGTREITVRTSLEHGLAVGIPINVQGTKSYTAEGSYIINSIPDEFTFTYLAKDVQPNTSSINDLYSSIITGEFFQGSQLRVKSIVTDAATPLSTLTVTTEATHGFGSNTPFYFLNLNSTIAQEFPASNTEARSFDSSNSATAQTFDGSNTLSSINLDFSNSATSGGFPSNITSGVDPAADTIEVTHPAGENFSGLSVGQALYYDVSAGSGFFQANPRGVVFLLTTDGLGESVSTFQVSEIPNGTPINITGAMSGTFQIANQARTFAGNNIDPATEVTLTVLSNPPIAFDGANENGSVVTNPQFDGTNQFAVTTASGVSDNSWAVGTMIRFDTDGTAPSGLTNGETYFVNQIFGTLTPGQYFMRLSEYPNELPITVGNDGTGTVVTFTQIGISTTKDVFHLPNHGLQEFDMLKYSYPDGGRFTADQIQDFYYVKRVYDQSNLTVAHTLGEITPKFQSFGPFDYGSQEVTTEINIVGFEQPYSFQITDGVLPSGLTLDQNTGVISGTPDDIYNATIRLVITDSQGSTDFMDIAFEFTQPPFLFPFSEAVFTTGGQTGPYGLSLSQGRNGVSSTNKNDFVNDTELYTVSNGYQYWTVPIDGVYRIEAYGARPVSYRNYSGNGVRMRGDFNLTRGEKLKMVVGQTTYGGSSQWNNFSVDEENGTVVPTPTTQNDEYDPSLRGHANNNRGGGGGTYVCREDNTILLIAGGGGGSGYYSSNSSVHATTSTSGRSGQRYGGGSNGGGGSGGYNSSGGGGGYSGNGGGSGGQAFLNGSQGGRRSSSTYWGGFGGGGNGYGSGGGGGGYSGGGTGDYGQWGGGGGSINNGTNQSNSQYANSQDGYIRITAL